MADKKKSGVSVVPEFVAGEQPTADKFNAIGVQLERAASELEKTVGDVWGESWPYSVSTNSKLTLKTGRKLTNSGEVAGASDSFLDIANIARLIGSASNLNPVITENSTIGDPVYTVTAEKLHDGSVDPIGLREFWLRFPPLSISSVTFSGSFGASLTNRVASHRSVKNPGDWFLSQNRKLTTYNSTASGQTLYVNYQTVPLLWGTGADVPGSSYNVIPDPNQTANGGAQCTATLSGAGYIIQLPVASHGKLNYQGSSVELNGDGDIALNNQLTLPRVLQENFIAGDIIPEGFVYLRDNVTGKLYNDAVYEYNDEDNIIIKNVTLDTSHGFSIITVGSTITEAIYDLRYKWFHHTHDGTFGESPIHISSIAGLLEDKADSGIYVDSAIPSNWMPQYLHRDGYTTDAWANDNNSMRGDLVFGIENGSPGEYLDSTATVTNTKTFAIKFGDGISNTEIYRGTTGGGAYPGTLNIFNDGSIYVNANGSTFGHKDITVRSDNGQVQVDSHGAGSTQFEGSMQVTNGGPNPYAPVAEFENVGILIDDDGGHIEALGSQVIVHGLAAGPVNDTTVDRLPLWSLNENGVGNPQRAYATYTGSESPAGRNGWRVPVFQTLYWAQSEVVFTGKDSGGLDASANNLIKFWQASIPLPDYLSSTAYTSTGTPYATSADTIIGFSLMAKSSVSNDTWWVNGGGARWENGGVSEREGEQIIASLYYDSSGGGYINIYISARGQSDGSPANYESDFLNSRFAGLTAEIDVKILLFVASPGGYTTLPTA